MSKQTAVDWLYFQLIKRINAHGDTGQLWATFQEAKAMEKEQIIDAVSKGWWNNENGLVSWIGEEYYNQTYKGGEE